MSVFPLLLGASQRFFLQKNQNTQQKHFAKKNLSKSFNQKSAKNSNLSFSRFFLSHFWAFLGKGSLKTPQKHYYKKSMSKKSTKISMSVFLGFLSYRVFGCFLAT
jgi:hypothetical protein